MHREVTSGLVLYCSHWVGVAQLAAAGGDRGKSLLIILSLRDAGLLQGNPKWGRCHTPRSLVLSCAYCAGNLLVTVSDWQTALQHMANPASHVMHSTDHVTEHNSRVTDSGTLVDKSHGQELTVSGLVYLLVTSVGPSLAAHILASVGGAVGGASGEEGAELHSLMVQLAAVHTQQKSVCPTSINFVVILNVALQDSCEVSSGEG